MKDATKSSSDHRRLPPLRMRLFDSQSAFTIVPSNIHQVLYRSEQSRGYPYEGNLWSPGFFHIDLTKDSLRHARCLNRKMGDHRGLDARSRCSHPSSNAALACSKMRFQKRGRSRGGIGFRGGPIHHHPSRPRARSGARTRVRR